MYSSQTLQLGERSYPIHVGPGLLQRLPAQLPAKRGFILADQILSSQALELKACLEAQGWQMGLHLAEATEKFKDFQAIYPLYGELLAAGLQRHSTLFALGGGVIGDAGGFLAATYLRGIAWIGIPSTLLAQVDSSVGGKTGINHEKGKNLIGAFHQPQAVWCDTNLLSSLPQRELISGLGEILKYGLIYGAEFYNFLIQNWEALLARDANALTHAITQSLAFKAQAVSADEYDLHGIREVLNFGHTIGHALETVTHYQHYKHGEAVIWGMQAAIVLSVWQGHLKAQSAQPLLDFLYTLPLPSLPAPAAAEALIQAIKYDKKSSGQNVRFVLLKDLGQTCSDANIPRSSLEQLFETALTQGRFVL